MLLAERQVDFEACFNFRDLGGYPAADGRRVRWGRLYRSDTLHRLTRADLLAFAALGLHTVVDLRTATELEDHGVLPERGRAAVTWRHIPLFDGVMRLQPAEGAAAGGAPAVPHGLQAAPEAAGPGQTYLQMLGDGNGVARAFDLLTGDGALPAVFHCTSGKDRTGMVAAMVLDLLGVDDEVIAHDYVLTNETRERANAWIATNEPAFAAFLAQLPPERRRTEPATILGFLEGVRHAHGSVEQLLVERGLAAERLEAFRDALLDGGAPTSCPPPAA